jgi:hypothetical protein
MCAPHNDKPAKTPQESPNDTIERVPMDDLTVALMKAFVPLATIAGWMAQALPPLAALASILWIGYQWYHSEPMKQRRQRRRAKGKRT